MTYIILRANRRIVMEKDVNKHLADDEMNKNLLETWMKKHRNIDC